MPVNFAVGQVLTAAQMNAAASDSGWQGVGLGNSWVNYGAPFMAAQYRLKGGIVYLAGLIKAGAAPVSVIFTLPAGYRPASSTQFVTVSAASTALIQVDNAGGVTLVSYGSGGANTAVSLNGITFIAEV
jgi:hypothetical protein